MRVALHLSAHPDDELLGAPATLMALRDCGWRIVNVACGLGRKSQGRRRGAELREACGRAGFDLHVAEPAVAMSAGDDAAAARASLLELIGSELEELGPQIVISPSPHDRHHAHELLGGAVRDALRERSGGPPWWMWGLWSSLPFPTLGTAFTAARLEEIVAALSAHRGELDRNDYRRLIRGRAEMNASLGPELLFGFGAAAPETCSHLELLTEVGYRGGGWVFGRPRWLDPAEPLVALEGPDAGAWLNAPQAADLFGAGKGEEEGGPDPA